MKRLVRALMGAVVLTATIHAAEFHVAITGQDTNPGTPTAPFRTIQRAANQAQPGDVITVHAGVYRERINPPRGGESDDKRIVYQAAPGEKVVIKGSEAVKNWVKVQDDVWQVTLPNSFFGGFNPYSDLLHGDWFNAKKRAHHTGAVYRNGDWLVEAAQLEDVLAGGRGAPPKPSQNASLVNVGAGNAEWQRRPASASSGSKRSGGTPLPLCAAAAVAPAGGSCHAALWYAQVDPTNTTIWAQFKGVNPNEQQVEINVRRTVFYPDQPGRNYITVRGFILRDAATPWAPPTAEQIGLIGTHWSKGWIIESNTISHSVCAGVALGKYGDVWDNRAGSATGYVGTINRALTNGWNKATVGSHLVRGNTISHCEQAGIVGSLGCAFSTVTGNVIHDIHVRQLFSGAEMAGIKFHGAIDVTIRHNHIFRTCRGLWLDWMAQGTRVSGNLFHENGAEDLFVEVDHGPYLVDNNIFLSPVAVQDWSQGGAYVHNLIAGTIRGVAFGGRQTPFHPAHSTAVAGLHNNPSGDDRFYNNLFVEHGNLSPYDKAKLPVWMEGNVFLKGTQPSQHEKDPLLEPEFDPAIKLVEKSDGFFLDLRFDKTWITARPRSLVTTALLGRAAIPNLPYEHPDGAPLRVATDYFGQPRNPAHPTPGPFETPGTGALALKVW